METRHLLSHVLWSVLAGLLLLLPLAVGPSEAHADPVPGAGAPMPPPPPPPQWDPRRDKKIRAEERGLRPEIEQKAAPISELPLATGPLPEPAVCEPPPALKPVLVDEGGWLAGVPPAAPVAPVAPAAVPAPAAALESEDPWAIEGAPPEEVVEVTAPPPTASEDPWAIDGAPPAQPETPTVPKAPDEAPMRFEPPAVEEPPVVAPVRVPDPAPMRFQEPPIPDLDAHVRKLLARPGNPSVQAYPRGVLETAVADVALTRGTRPVVLLFVDNASAASDLQASTFLPVLKRYETRVDIVPIDVKNKAGWSEAERKLVRTYFMASVPTTVVLGSERRPLMLKFQRVDGATLEARLESATRRP